MSRPDRIPLDDVATMVIEWPSSTGYGPAIARKWDVPLATARRWVAEARRRGLLPANGAHPCPTCKGSGIRTYGTTRRERP